MGTDTSAELANCYNVVLDQDLQTECGLTKAAYIAKRRSFLHKGGLSQICTLASWHDALKGSYRKTFVEMFKEFTCPNSPDQATPYRCAMPTHEAWQHISSKYRTIHEDIMNGNP